MSAPHPAPDTPQPAGDPAVARAELRLAKLQRLSDKALAMAEAVNADGGKETAEAFARLSRATRLTITLEAKLDEALSARLAGAIAEAKAEAERVREEAAKDPYAPLKTGMKARVGELVRDVIDHEIPDPEEHDILVDALEERLLCDEAYGTIDHLPPRDIVEHICADLELSPDWRRWDGDDWIPDPPFTRPLCSDFATPSRRPILTDAPDPETDPGPDALE